MGPVRKEVMRMAYNGRRSALYRPTCHQYPRSEVIAG